MALSERSQADPTVRRVESIRADDTVRHVDELSDDELAAFVRALDGTPGSTASLPDVDVVVHTEYFRVDHA